MAVSDTTARLLELTITPRTPLGEALARLDRAGTGALALCADGGRLVGLLTDGDVRRAILRGVSLDVPAEDIATLEPVTARPPLSAVEALQLMSRHNVNHLPVVDEQGRLLDLMLRTSVMAAEDLRARARERLESVVVAPDLSVVAAISRLDKAGTGALVLCTEGGQVRGLLTDGDIRRAILRGVSLEQPVESIATGDPLTARGPISGVDALALMTRHDVNQLPVVDVEGRLVEFLLRRDLVQEQQAELSAVIMAGGYGTRLLPLTEHVPKPMLPVGDRPLLERTIEQLRRSGISEVNLTTHYLPEQIVEHFGDGGAFGVKLTYLREDQPLGTAGGLKLGKRPPGPFVVINGDVLTGVSYQGMLDYHRRHGAELTVGVRKYEIQVPFGVVECDDERVTHLREKPVLTLLINAGIYLLEPSVFDAIPDGVRFDMTDLIQLLLREKRVVVSFPIIEYWQDVGRLDDYRQAQEDVRNGRI